MFQRFIEIAIAWECMPHSFVTCQFSTDRIHGLCSCRLSQKCFWHLFENAWYLCKLSFGMGVSSFSLGETSSKCLIIYPCRNASLMASLWGNMTANCQFSCPAKILGPKFCALFGIHYTQICRYIHFGFCAEDLSTF